MLKTLWGYLRGWKTRVLYVSGAIVHYLLLVDQQLIVNFLTAVGVHPGWVAFIPLFWVVLFALNREGDKLHDKVTAKE